MVTITYDNSVYECAIAVRTEHDIYMYDTEMNLVQHISNIYGEEWDYISIENGDWTNPNDIPTEKELLNHKLDQMQANLDYCLMLLEM